MDNFVQFLNRYKKIWIPAVACILVAVIVLLIVLNRSTVQVEKALDPSNDMYERMQIKITLRTEDISPDVSSEDSTLGGDVVTSGMEDGGDTYIDQNGYYNEFGSFVPDVASDTEGTASQDNAVENKITLKKDGDVYYENGTSGEMYFYKRDGQNYVMYYDDHYGMKKDDGEWVEVPAGNYSLKCSFDISLLKSVDRARLQKSGDVYIPQLDYLEELFFTLLSISENNRENYLVSSLSIAFDKDRISRIVASSVYKNDLLIEQTMDFTYNNTKIELPQVDRVYGED